MNKVKYLLVRFERRVRNCYKLSDVIVMTTLKKSKEGFNAILNIYQEKKFNLQ